MPQIRKKELEFLNAEIEAWLDADIITAEQAGEISGLYEVKPRNLRMILLIAGGVLLALGLVSFIAAHWHELNKLLRIGLISGAYLASLAAYLFTRAKHRYFLLLASVIFGAGIYLIARMYDYKLSFAAVLGWWVIEVILTIIITRDVWQMYLAQVIAFLYLNESNEINFFALQFMNLPRVALLNFFAPVKAFILVLALWAAWSRIHDRAAFNLNMLLTLLLTASRLSLCLGGTWTLIILVLAGAVMSLISSWHDTEFIGLLMLGLFGLLLTWPEFWRGEIFEAWKNTLSVCSALIVSVLMLVNIYRGHSATGITFCVMLVSRYFFDHLFGYMPKAWGFTGAGIIFLSAGLFFGKFRQ